MSHATYEFRVISSFAAFYSVLTTRNSVLTLVRVERFELPTQGLGRPRSVP